LSQYNLLYQAADLAHSFLSTVPMRPVGVPEGAAVLAGGPLPDDGEDPARVIAGMAETAEAGLVASNGPRYFGFVTGGSLPAALAADWLTSAWDQNASLHVMSPAAAAFEATAAAWLVELFGLPPTTSVGFTTGRPWPISRRSRRPVTPSWRAMGGTSPSVVSPARRGCTWSSARTCTRAY